MMGLNKRILVGTLVMLDTADVSASFQVSILSIPKLRLRVKVCLNNAAVPLAHIFKDRSEARNEN